MTVEIDDSHRLLRFWHYTNSHTHQSGELSRKCTLGERAPHEARGWRVHKVFGDFLPGGGGTVRLDGARLWYCWLAGCVVDLAGVVDCFFGERDDAVR